MNSRSCDLREQKLQGYIIKKLIAGCVLHDELSYCGTTAHKNIFSLHNGVCILVTEREKVVWLLGGFVALYCLTNLVVSQVLLPERNHENLSQQPVT
jgi:hypothetical protein